MAPFPADDLGSGDGWGDGSGLTLSDPEPLVFTEAGGYVIGPDPDHLHLPSGPPVPGPPGRDGGLIYVPAADPAPYLSVVYLDAQGARLASSDRPETVALVAGVTLSSGTPGVTVTVGADGASDLVDTALPPGPLYLSPTGGLTADPDTGTVRLRVATLYPDGRLVVRLHPSIHHH